MACNRQRHSSASALANTLSRAGATLGTPLAATIDARENALYIVDRVATTVRLVRVDLVAERATVIAPRLVSTTPSAVS